MPLDPAEQTAYQLEPLFQIRMAGVPFDVLEPLATPRAMALARELAPRSDALEHTARAALDALRADPAGLPRRRLERLRRAIGMRLPLPAGDPGGPAEVAAYAAGMHAVEELRARHARALDEELAAASVALHAAARRYLADYSVFVSASVEELAFADPAGGGEPRWDRERDRTLLMYLQRLATKNETFSAYGPSGWGTVDAGARGLRLDPRPALRREAFLERWVADAIVAAVNGDPSARPELAPRLHPSARLEGASAVRVDTGARVALDAEARALLLRCDGATPAHALGAPERLAALAEQGVLLWRLETPAFVLDRIGALRTTVGSFRDGVARRRWEPFLAALAELPAAFAREGSADRRRDLVRRARAALADVGVHAAAAAPQRTLYRASNPILEECTRECGFVLGGDLAGEIAGEAAPWLDFWRDTYAFVAHRVNEKLRALLATVAGPDGAAPLPAFLRAADAANLPLGFNGLPTLAYVAFQEVKAAFRAAMSGRPDAKAWALGASDLAFVRRRFEFPRFDEFTWPSADLQLAAASVDDVRAGRHRWVVAELHIAAVAIQHGIYWGCPDLPAFGRTVRTIAGGPVCDWGFVPADLVNHTLLHSEPIQDRWSYVGPNVMPPGWATVRPADAEVHVAAEGDVRIRGDGRDLGSFARSWVLGLGFHPFVFSLGAHTPRLEVGRVVVQRETWTLGRADLPRAPYAASAPELAVDVDRLRAARGIPRHVYVRPTDAAVRRLGAGGRDKDVKPVYLDLESRPFLEVLARWMARHGELELAEMLPAPGDLLWRDDAGRRTFELRTLFGPRRAT